MRIDKMTACFGRLKNETLAPGPGLTVIEAPNESGKSTWCAFLRTMLYGLSTRERGFLADKNRYAPWDGSPMRGIMELTAKGRSVTLTRDTQRSSAPMGRFSAVYTGTAEPVPQLTGANCGDLLLGIPREVFERSAFIRQSGLAVTQDAELERRIAALLSTGEEGVSYSEAYGALKNELNHRRHNKTGLLPRNEAELAEVRDTIRRTDALRDDLTRLGGEKMELEREAAEVSEKLHLHDLADAWAEQQSLDALRMHAEKAAEALAEKQAALDADGLPVEETLRQLLSDTSSARSALAAKQETERALTEKECREAQADFALSAHPMAPQTPEAAAEEPLPIGERPRPKILYYILGLLPGIIAALCGSLLLHRVALSVGLGLLIIAADLLAVSFRTASLQKAWEAECEQLRLKRDQELAEYRTLYEEAQTARSEREETAAALFAMLTQQQEALRALFGAVALFAPEAKSLDGAENAIREALRRHAEVSAAEGLAQEAKLRYDIREQNRRFPSAPAEQPAPRPAENRAELQNAYAMLTGTLQDTLRQESRIEGELRAGGDYGTLSARETELAQKVETLQEEYDALALAMQVLSDANTELQSRFSPELGKCAGRIFSSLTGGKYDSVFLDRELNASAGETDGSFVRSAAVLSQGSADQLALRLAICEMVLPQESSVPLILDDALVSFDDARMELALRYLLEESKGRQILLFTCQSREREALRGESGAEIITL